MYLNDDEISWNSLLSGDMLVPTPSSVWKHCVMVVSYDDIKLKYVNVYEEGRVSALQDVEWEVISRDRLLKEDGWYVFRA